MIDINKIIDDNNWKTDEHGELDYTHTNMKNAIKQAIKQSIPEILRIVSEGIISIDYFNPRIPNEFINSYVDKKGILSLQSKIEKELNI